MDFRVSPTTAAPSTLMDLWMKVATPKTSAIIEAKEAF